MDMIKIGNFDQLKSKLLLENTDQSENRSLLILDNCYEFIRANRISFFENIYFLKKEISNLKVVLITEKKVIQKKFKIKHLEILPLDFASSITLLKSQMPDLHEEN